MKGKIMPFYAMNERVRAQVNGQNTVGKLVNVNFTNRKFLIETEHGSFWITQDDIVAKIK